MNQTRRLLIIAFHFPPIQGGSGVHRMLSYARYLPEMGWDVKILTVTPGAYESVNTSNTSTIPETIEVIRAPALDTARHLAWRGRYLRTLALPDRWQSWILTGTVKGIQIIRKWRPTAIISTFPIASAHVIGLHLSRLFKIPWVADFRDPMAMSDYPDNPIVRKCYWWIEKQVIEHAAAITVTTPGTCQVYKNRYGEKSSQKISVIPNGFDETLFPQDKIFPPQKKDKHGPLTILHSGLVYSYERDPTQLFHAIAELRDEGLIDSDKVCFIFRASGYSNEFKQKFSHLKLEGLVKFEDESIPYKDAIQELLGADVLLVLQGAVCNIQIPAKVYEYLGAGRPILALTDPAGDTAGILKTLGGFDIVRIDEKEEIKKKLPGFIKKITSGNFHLPEREKIIELSRAARTKELNSLLENGVENYDGKN
ncbi:glycosyltransferase [Desulfobacter postgatei]|uniref:Glycosyltransferase subfamily 4-like N-terminal domain-containing protein n=1 Tax=Desulfobacter postgatei 2ac9 TaxID=879212 RepID=I5B265_9BACT|nr:glycosyltransferase [Desulfobacter postgatei]EIM63578.1 hypothetical protein DespoDRAFT_01654 [Desulfobacter postgatei 2ac9]